MTDETKTNEEQVQLNGVGEIDLPTIDITPYIGKRAKIELVTEHKGKHGYYVKIQTEIMEKIEGKGKDKKVIELRGSKVLGLQEDENDKVGWGASTKMGLFLKKYEVKHYADLTGKTVILQSHTAPDGREFLSFN